MAIIKEWETRIKIEMEVVMVPTVLNDGICDNFVDEDGDGICDNCPNDGVCDGTGPRGAGNGQGAGNGAGDQIHARDGSCISEE